MLVHLQQIEASRRNARHLHRRRLCLYDRSYSPLRFQEPSLVSHKRNSAGLFVHLLSPGSEPASTHNYVLFAKHARQRRPLCAFGHFAAARQQPLPEVEARAAVCAIAVSEC